MTATDLALTALECLRDRPAVQLASSLRSRAPEATFDTARWLMPSLGISRVTDITRLDTLGLPVFASVRPRGLALCVHAGKGLQPADARIGALMEAVEFAAAEPWRNAWQPHGLRIADLEDGWAGAFDLLDLAPRFGVPVAPDRLLDVVRCEDVATGAATWLPAELVFLPYADPHGPALFGWSSNGLASGNTLAEATLHGLLEVLERDALGMNLPRDGSRWLPPEDYPPPFDALARAWRDIGVDSAVRLVPSSAGLPCFQAVLMQDSRDHSVDLAEGSGLHLDAGIAFARAMCEAAQSRAGCIHGGRDDLTDFYDRLARQGAQRDARSTLMYREAFDTSRPVRWSEVPTVPVQGAQIDALLARLLQRVADSGLGPVLRHRFALPTDDLHVVKVIVPGCQMIETPLERASRRLLALARQVPQP